MPEICVDPGALISPEGVPEPGAADRPTVEPEEPGAEPSPVSLGSLTPLPSVIGSCSPFLAFLTFPALEITTLGFFTSFAIESIRDDRELLLEIRASFD